MLPAVFGQQSSVQSHMRGFGSIGAMFRSGRWTNIRQFKAQRVVTRWKTETARGRMGIVFPKHGHVVAVIPVY